MITRIKPDYPAGILTNVPTERHCDARHERWQSVGITASPAILFLSSHNVVDAGKKLICGNVLNDSCQFRQIASPRLLFVNPVLL